MTFDWTYKGKKITSDIAGLLTLKGRERQIWIDEVESFWVVEVNGLEIKVIAGPVNGAQALVAAESLLAGIQDHESVTHLINTLALGIIAQGAQIDSLTAELEGRSA